MKPIHFVLSFLKIPVTIAHAQVKVKLDNFTSETYVSKGTERLTAIHKYPTFKHLMHVRERSELLPSTTYGKVMFLHVSVILSMGGGCLPDTPWADPLSDTPASRHHRDGHCSGWYASYYNAFLLCMCHKSFAQKSLKAQ